MQSIRIKSFIISLVISVLFSACSPGARPQSSASPQPQATPPPAVSRPSMPSPAITDPDVLNACPVEEQSQAMRGSQIPDWQHIGIFACYQLSLDLSDSSRVFPGTELLVFNNQTGSTLTEIVLRVYPNARNIYSGKMDILSVRMDGKDLPFDLFLSDQSGLRIHLDHPLQPNATARLEVAFQLEVPLDFGTDGSYGVFNQSSSGPTLNLANWYPILAIFQEGRWQADPVLMGGDAVTSQTGLYRVEITAPETWKIASTGTQIHQINENGLSKHMYVSGPVRDFMIAASPIFEKRQVQAGDVAIVQWGATDTAPAWDAALEDARSAFIYYENMFGPYPFNELDIVASQLQNASGVEYPGLVLIIDSSYQSNQQREFLKLVIAHEIAHQWWYSVVGNDVLRDPWQDEALATYSSLMVLEESSPQVDYLRRYQAQVADYDKQKPGQSIEQPLEAFQTRISEYGLVVYLKGALFFNAIRNQIGDAAFTQALKAYYQQNKYRLANPSNILDTFTQTCRCSLSDIAQEYGVEVVNP